MLCLCFAVASLASGLGFVAAVDRPGRIAGARVEAVGGGLVAAGLFAVGLGLGFSSP